MFLFSNYIFEKEELMEGGERKIYQVIIIGGGPAGLTAGLYTPESRLQTLLIEIGLLGDR